MSTSGKCLFPVFCKTQTPMAERTVRYPQVPCDLGLGFFTGLPQMHCFQLKFLGVRWSRFLHDLVLFWESLLFPIYSLHVSGSRPSRILPSFLSWQKQPRTCQGCYAISISYGPQTPTVWYLKGPWIGSGTSHSGCGLSCACLLCSTSYFRSRAATLRRR